MYAEGWRQKIELNASLELLNGATAGTYVNPVVTVALRRDGSVESVVFNRSSGSQDVDAAVRRIIVLLSPYTPFPADVAQDYDVIEIQRVWTFDKAVRLFSGGR
jgi:outer membrane biosynthesis protein TonB